MPTKDQNEIVKELAAQKQEKSRARMYCEVNDEAKAAALSAKILHNRNELAKAAKRKKVNFHDLDEVEQRTCEYLNACAKSATFPSVDGLAAFAYGYTKDGLNKFLRAHPDSDSAEYIMLVKACISDILTNSGLSKLSSDAMTIFILKNSHGFSDRVEVEPVLNRREPDLDLASIEEIEQRYAFIIDETEDHRITPTEE